MSATMTVRPQRPKVTAPAVTRVAAEALLPALAEWNGGELSDEERASALRLLPGMVYLDTYEMAREFERDGWNADSGLVDALDGWDFLLRRAHLAAVREWISANDVRPRLAVGAVVNVPRDPGVTGEIARVDEHEGAYLVRIDAHGHVREGLGTHGRIFAWEEVEAADNERRADG
jgi:hypothetical protein